MAFSSHTDFALPLKYLVIMTRATVMRNSRCLRYSVLKQEFSSILSPRSPAPGIQWCLQLPAVGQYPDAKRGQIQSPPDVVRLLPTFNGLGVERRTPLVPNPTAGCIPGC